ncbi:MAG: amino acid adenylation domain-containing protein [Bacteroidota bacterium]
MQSTYDLEDIYPLSPMQEGMLFHHLLDTSDANYFEQMNCRWSGDIIVEAVEQSMNDLMARYEVLRTVFLHEGFSQPLQLVLKERKVDFKLIDVREECTDKPRREVVSEYCLKDRSQTFNLGKDVLMRLTILHTGEQEYELIWSHHHILMDGWCMGIIFSDFQSIYAGYLGIEKTQLPAVQPYSKYINWLASHEGVSSDDYWSKYLVEYDSQATMLPGNATQEKLPYNKQIHSLEISDDTMSSVTQLSKEHGITLYTLMQTAWGIVLSNYNNTTDVVFGSVVSGRPAEIAGIEDMVGLFINTVPVRVTYDSEDKIIDLLKNVQKVGVSGEEHHYYPLWKIQETNDLGGDLFDHILLFENFPIAETVKDANNASENVYEVDDYDSFDQTNFDLALTITSGATTCVDFEFNASAYQAEYIQSIATHLEQVIKQISLSGGLRIADIEMVTDKEKSLLSQVSNGATIDLPVDKTIVDLINEQVLLTPDQVAVVDGGTSMSYSQLNTESNHLANFLVQEVKIEAGDIVVLHLNKSIELVTSILAIWKTGATFIPVDVNLPNDRISTLLDAIKPNMIITEHELAEINKIARDLDQEIPCLIFGQEISDELELRTNLYSESQLNNYSSNEFINEASQNGLAYLIYTSGSTGQPKAVKIQHRQYLNATLSWRKDYALEDSTVNLLQMANPAFDVFMGDISRSLANGGKMVLCTDQIKLDFPKLASTIEEHQISIFEATPALVFPFLDYLTDNNLSIPSVSLLIVGSDICKFEDFKKHRAELPTDVRIINSYGITETTIDTCFYEEEFQQMSESGIVPIGRPMSGMKVYILNQNLQQQPLNVLGEIYIGGSSVGAGYHNQEELTAMRFIPNPWANGERMYKTGDIGKWLPDYNLELLGRADHQIKIRGFRVELGEIENLLLAHSSVKEAVVVAGENEFGKYLAAYSILEEADVISVKELRDYISNRLPDYMVPAYIIFIEKMPLSTNGKVDRKALPQPSISIDKEARALKTATEQTLADLWSEVLSVNRDIIGTNSSFFELGGHSIKAFHLMNSIQEIFTVRLKLQDLFSNVILSDQARLIDGKDKKEIKAIENIGQKAYFPTSPAQDRLYYQQMLNKDSTVFNNHEALEINGEVQLDRLGKTFKALINRHESLRTSFKFVDGGLTQIIQDEVDFNIEEVELTQNTELEKSLFDFIRPFDLNNGPLLRVGLIKAQDVNLLVFDVHHIVCDGVSLELLVRDFYNIYKGQPLSDLPVRYVDYAHWMKENQVDMEDQMDYWVQKLSGKITPLELPTLHDREEVDIQAADSRSLFIGQELSDAIRALNAETNTSEFMFLISIFYILLEKITASSDIIIGSDVVGRSEDSLKDIVGTFVNLLPLRMQLKEECTYEEFLEGVKSCVLEAYDHQDCQFDDLMNRLGIKAAQNTNPIVQVHFSFDNSVDGEKELTEMDFSPYYNEGTREIQYELELEAARLEEDINITFSYSKQLYDEETIDQLMHYYKNILITVLQQKDISLSAIELESSIEA